jgi:NAD(P)-dependent dehydrogenase (short-subunit alcohol dehydrogenase family)
MSKFDAQFAGRLDGQTVLVTGTKGGIGHETAQGIGNSGATVLVHARRVDDAQRAVDLLVNNGNGKGQYLPVAADLGSLAGVRQLVDAVHEAAPKGLNGLVNNAGAAFSSKALSRRVRADHRHQSRRAGGTDRRAARPAPEGR